ncbi:MAG: hypothetical protein A2589_02385 [Candidatus Vogelbacteria bacterium RIFOXYD1_FULL_46_19]|uniref:Uncharacterized protein n=1 Tax=Candidatus Vogelbacteria bacterium RIFOXYD1_FULL_46_19 TaxID=1802439 RepID=A0A1G2QI29_9BACT|nr:MAG: hypothetical protein A2589_02385 [Candidatus Vogelbacteria bacterium RIFOXYD1_FULL_46_19]
MTILDNKVFASILFVFIIVTLVIVLRIQEKILKKIINLFETKYTNLNVLPKSYFVKLKQSNFFYYSNIASWSNWYLLKNYSNLPKDISELFKKMILLWIITPISVIVILILLFLIF